MMKIQDLSMMETLRLDRSRHGAIGHIQGGNALFEIMDSEIGFLATEDMLPAIEITPVLSGLSMRSSFVEGNSSSTASSFSIDS